MTRAGWIKSTSYKSELNFIDHPTLVFWVFMSLRTLITFYTVMDEGINKLLREIFYIFSIMKLPVKKLYIP